VIGTFEPYRAPRPIPTPDYSGGMQTLESPGEVSFELLGQRLRLVVAELDEGELFLVFADGTTGRSTYPAGRFLYTPPPSGQQVEIDFNKAYSPPCAFTPYATCPLPLPENRLPISIEAGERDPGPS
jgi:uncharacterized protein (DUF1684 family)